MARVDIALTQSAINAGANITEVDLNTGAASGMKVAADKDGKIIIVVDCTHASAQTLTVKAPTGAEYSNEGQGDLAITTAQNVQQAIIVEGARFLQADGYVYLDCTTDATGAIAAINADF